MRANVPRIAAIALLGVGSVVSAHEDPPGCATTGVALTVALYRADGSTGLSGAASECERMIYRVHLAKVTPTACALSSGTLTLTTPDGVVHALATPVPCIGGTVDDTPGTLECPPARTSLDTDPIPYEVRPGDVVGGKLRAIAHYEGGVFHDRTGNTPGISAMVDRNVQITSCSDADPCTVDLCDPSRPNVAACSNPPLCDDDDPTTDNDCTAGRCTFTPIASSERVLCGTQP
jgi:hypothetical protein